MCEAVTTKQYLTKVKLSAQKKLFQLKVTFFYLALIGPCIANIFSEFNQQRYDVSLFISVRRCTCFRWVFRPSSVAQNCVQRQVFFRPLQLPASSR